jgi:hypothetical protein
MGMNPAQLGALGGGLNAQHMNQLRGLMPPNMLGSRVPFGGMSHAMGADGKDKPFRRNATHVAIAYFIKAAST